MTPGIQEVMRAVEKVRDEFRRAVSTGDVDAALAVCAPDIGLVRLPVATGARGIEALRTHLAEDVVPHLPGELSHRRVSRTVDRFRVVDEELVTLRHDRELPWLLPGVPATGLLAEVLTVTVVTVRQARITSVRALWDHAGLLTRLGVAPDAVPVGGLSDPGTGPASWW